MANNLIKATKSFWFVAFINTKRLYFFLLLLCSVYLSFSVARMIRSLFWLLSLLLVQAHTHIHMVSKSHKFYRRPDISQGKSPNRFSLFCCSFFLFCRLIQWYFANAAQTECMSFDIRFSCTFTLLLKALFGFHIIEVCLCVRENLFPFLRDSIYLFFLLLLLLLLLSFCVVLFPPSFTRLHRLTLPSSVWVCLFVCVCVFFSRFNSAAAIIWCPILLDI